MRTSHSWPSRVCWNLGSCVLTKSHYHRPYQADAWSTAFDRFWVGTSLNHLASSFQDTIHILCGRISLLLHATVMANPICPPSNETFFCTFYARYILEGTLSFKARSKKLTPQKGG